MQFLKGQIMMSVDGNALKSQKATGEMNLMGQPIMADDGDLTLGKVAINALVGQFDDERNLSGEEKVKRWAMAVKINGTPDPGIDFTPEEIVLIKKLIGKAYGPAVCGPAWTALEGKQ